MKDSLFTADERAPRRAPGAPRGRASDLFRGRDMLAAALVAAVCAVVAYVVFPAEQGAQAGIAQMTAREAEERMPGPLIRPHVVHELGCVACHTSEAPAKAACVRCHGPHPSTRTAHKALAKSGQLACVDCHAAHGDMQGVTFSGESDLLRFGLGAEERARLTQVHAPAGATVPLVPVTACARCHDPTRASDPFAACISKGAKVALCLDEHQSVYAPLPVGSSACKAQHSPSRYVAWEAAREAAHVIPWVAAASARDARAPLVWPAAGAAGGLAAYAAIALGRRVFRSRKAKRAPALPVARVRLPVIDTSTCLGCYACVDACPFDVLEIERYVAVVRRPADCCGVSLCQQVCPNGSLQITEGEVIPDRPRTDEHLESTDVPGIFLAGDLTGLPLIKNAIAQGVRAVDRIVEHRTKRKKSPAGVVDVAIVGAGPAGLSAALRAQEKGLSYALLEQETMAQSIKSFPRNKLVFDQPLDIPVHGALWLKEATKEELLAEWTRIVRQNRLEILEHHRVLEVKPEDGGFLVRATTGEAETTVRAASVVLAIGRRGTPRKLEAHVARGAESKVSYALADARSLAHQKVLIVGLGDSAMEAACAIARQPGAAVTIVHRGKDFARGKSRNIAEVKELLRRGKIRVLFESAVERVDPDRVLVRGRDGREEIANDLVLALIGGVPSWEMLEAAGMKRSGPAIQVPVEGEVST